MAVQEPEHPPPGVLAHVGVLIEAPVEERVWGPGVHVSLVLDAGGRERLVEPLDILNRDRLILATEQAEHRAAHLGGAIDRAGDPEPRSVEDPVEADRGRQPGDVGRGQERFKSAEAEADGGRREDPGALRERGRARREVVLDALDLELLDVWHVLEVLIAWPEARGPSEVVEHDCVISGLGEALGQIGVERVQPADVRQDHDPAPPAGRFGDRRGELRAVRGGQLELLGARAPRDRRQEEVGGWSRWAGVEVKAHGRHDRNWPEMTSPRDPASFRSQFPVFERLSYLNAGTEGPVPRQAAEAAHARLDLEVSGGRCGKAYFEELMDLAERLRAGYAGVLGCEAAEVALTGSTTDGVNTVLAGLDLHSGDEIVTSDEEHPGLLAPLGRARLRHGISVRVVPFTELPGEIGPATRLVACSHVSWVSGRVADVSALCAAGAPVLLDAAQALGAVPVDVRALGCDFYAASGQKWLCGPEGSGSLYVREDRLDDLLIPWPGYASVADPARALEFEPAEGVKRLDHGFPPRFAARGRSRRSRSWVERAGAGSTSAALRLRHGWPSA